MYSDPKYIEKPQCIKSYWSKELETHMQKPVKFEYSNGLVKNVFTEPSEPVLCANMKKAILNLLHVDIKGKDEQTKLNYAFTKQEVSEHYYSILRKFFVLGFACVRWIIFPYPMAGSNTAF